MKNEMPDYTHEGRIDAVDAWLHAATTKGIAGLDGVDGWEWTRRLTTFVCSRRRSDEGLDG